MQSFRKSQLSNGHEGLTDGHEELTG
jgi:hypothetical protein